MRLNLIVESNFYRKHSNFGVILMNLNLQVVTEDTNPERELVHLRRISFTTALSFDLNF